MRDYFKKMKYPFCYGVISIVVAAFVGWGLLTLSYMIPQDRIRDNAVQSVLSTDRDDLWLNKYKIVHTNDSFTDKLMINIAIFKSHDKTSEQALLNPYNTLGLFSLVHLVSSIRNKQVENVVYINYGRYWHGYLTIIKPLLVFYNYNQMRIMSMFLQVIAMLVIMYLIYKRFGILFVVAFGSVAIFCDIVEMAIFFEYSTSYTILLISLLVLLLYEDVNVYKLFFWNGVALAYFCYLAFPLLIWAIPMIVYLLLNMKSVIEGIKDVVKCGVAWFVGYVGMWFAKWSLASAFTKEDVIKDGIDNLLYRLKGEGHGWEYIGAENLNLKHVIHRTLGAFDFNIIEYMFLVFGAVALFYFLFKKCKIKFDGRIIPILLVGLSPIVWFSMVQNHTIIHPHFAYRLWGISIFAVMCSIALMMKPKTIGNDVSIDEGKEDV